jgi:hypothetical protein
VKHDWPGGIRTVWMAFAGLIVLANATVGSAATINVPADHGTIQAAINVSVNGDEIVVAPGIYVGAIDFLGKSITIRSASGDPSDTTINGNGAFHVVFINSSGNARLEGLTITGGDASGAGSNSEGGGVWAFQSTLTVENCILENNLAAKGGGAFVFNGASTFLGCEFSNNNGGGASAGGGGIFRGGSGGTLTVDGCTFTGNTATQGGAIMIFFNGPGVTISDSVFDGNSAGFGGALQSFSNGMTMDNCLFMGNTATNQGGACGVTNSVGIDPQIVNCTFTQNSSPTGALFMQNSAATPIVTNCILWNNGGATEAHQIGLNGASPTVTYCDIQGLSALNVMGSNNIGDDPVNDDPKLADPGMGDFSLDAGSAAIDAGNSAAVPMGVTTDLAGNPRITGAAVDMGAFESGPAIDSDGDGLLDATEIDIANGGGCPDPFDSDSDDDGLSDGDEVLDLGTNPCSADSDGDGVTDDIDDAPLDDGVSDGLLVELTEMTADGILAMDLSGFTGPNANANSGRQNSLSARVRNAANALEGGDEESAIELLISVLERVDGESPPADWMDDSVDSDNDLISDRQELEDALLVLINLILM